MRGLGLGGFQMINLPNFTLIFCRISVVGASSFAVAGRQVGHSGYNLSGLVVELGLMPERCSCSYFASFVVVHIDFAVGVGFGRAGLGAAKFFDLRPQPLRQFSCEVQLVCFCNV